MSNSVLEMTILAKQATISLAGHATGEMRNQALLKIAQELQENSEQILAANVLDCQEAKGEIPESLYARLKLGENKLNEAIKGIYDLIKLDDPVGKVDLHRELDTGLVLKRVSTPLGLLGVIFEARPEALIQITCLAIKSSNGVILKGGKEATNTCQTLVKLIKQALKQTEISPDLVQLLTTREEIGALLTLDEYIDLIIPRGSNSFVRYVQQNTQIPVLGHADGICHLYIDQAAELQKAIDITVDAKTQYPSACNTIETLLIHKDIAASCLPPLATALEQKQVELRGDEIVCRIIQAKPATAEDWKTEYADLILSLKVVDSLEEAIEHINTYGSRHTDAIVSQDEAAIKLFLSKVDAAGVFANCSTRFADGFRYGFGAEVGISTQKMPPRGPVGLEGLVTYKYQLVGDGQIVANYSGANARPFTHKTFKIS
jgi:glutamate-5-semialdehyde dehydrogenase